tara:strand:- start:1013 stop:1246 length:234 start_codon:yes stop_codon:yes gene_type:complete
MFWQEEISSRGLDTFFGGGRSAASAAAARISERGTSGGATENAQVRLLWPTHWQTEHFMILDMVRKLRCVPKAVESC